jgi:hypothetical protein
LDFDPSRFDPSAKTERIDGGRVWKLQFEENAVRLVECIGQLGQPAGPIGRRHFAWYAEHRRPLIISRFSRL